MSGARCRIPTEADAGSFVIDLTYPKRPRPKNNENVTGMTGKTIEKNESATSRSRAPGRGFCRNVRVRGRATVWTALLATLLGAPGIAAQVNAGEPRPASSPPAAVSADAMRVIQLVEGNPLQRNFPAALTSLIQEINDTTTLELHPDPLIISSFEDERIFRHPIVYVNFGDKSDWNLNPDEKRNLKQFLDRGGFLYIDAGINAEFLRGDVSHGQHHSFADWQVSPVIEALFREIYPDKAFRRLSRSHRMFRSFYSGLPPADELPDTVHDYVVEEKWPQGTYSFMGLHVDDRIAVLASPIVAMGWGRTERGTWANTISFRVRQSSEGLEEQLREAAYGGERFEAVREDGRKDVIYSQEPATPSWVREPDGTWRIFRYYHSREISDYAHVFYTQLGVNIFVHALTN